MKSTNYLLSLGLLALQSNQVYAYWRMACSVSQNGRADPILNPGGASGHVHKFAGGNNVNEWSTFDSLQSSTCSSCEVQADKSAYWTPQLYYAHSNGTFEEVPNYGMTVYYVGRGGNSSNTIPFPPGFRMISGSSKMRSYDSQNLTYMNTRPVADRVSFHCIDAANDIPEQHYMFRTDCVNGMRAQINFQSCWDGVNLYLPSNAHVNYLSGIDYGVCPPSHPVSIPGLFFEVLYWTNLIDQSTGGQFVFANGDTTGYGFHGDFMNGWNMTTQTAAVRDCLYIDTGGVVSNCPDLASVDDANFPRDCPQQPPLNDEPVTGLLSALPGCNPVTGGPNLVPQVVCPLNSHQPSSQTLNATTQTSTISSATSNATATTSATDSAFSASFFNSTLTTSPLPVNASSQTPSMSLSEASSYMPTSGTATTQIAGNALLASTNDSNSASFASPTLSGSPSLSTTLNFAITAGAFFPNSTTFAGQTLMNATITSATATATVLPAAVQNGTVVTITLTEMVTLTVTIDPGTQPTASASDAQRNFGNEQLVTSSATTFVQQGSTITVPGSTITLPASTPTVDASAAGSGFEYGPFSDDGASFTPISPSIVTIPGTTFVQADITVTFTEYDFVTTTVIAGNAVTLAQSTITVPPNALPTAPGDLVTITLPDQTVTQAESTVTIQGNALTQPANLVTIPGTTFTITGTYYTTVEPSRVAETSSDGTSTTTVFSTSTTFVTVYATSTIKPSSTPVAVSENENPTTGTITPASQISGTASTTGNTTESSTAVAPPSVSSPEISANTATMTASPTTIMDSGSSSSFSSSTSFLDVSAACSLYSTFLPSGCPSPTPGLENITVSPTSTFGRLTTTFITLTEAITDDITSTTETTLTLSSESPSTTVFRIRGRQVYHAKP